ncbi:MAG: hypothetical protein JRJ85_09795, partial [Deltaproteobacteria bacterium]|nr:hypothetical protein [Deltaproteobacteria bacterium]
ATYQILLDHWESLVPGSTREKINLYVLRSDYQKVRKLARIYQSEGMTESDATGKAEKNQAVLCNFRMPTTKFKGILEGLDLLKQAGGISFLAHPAVDHWKIGYEDFDRHILYPLLDSGLDGIEVFYPYDRAYRQEAIAHYRAIAENKGVLISGGTDFHGDGRVGLADVKLDAGKVRKILRYHNKNLQALNSEIDCRHRRITHTR